MKSRNLALQLGMLTVMGIVMGLSVNHVVTAKVAPVTKHTVGQIDDDPARGVPPFMFEASYAAVPFDEMVRTADVVVAGSVIDISKTKWNQDNGEYWEEIIRDDVGETRLSAMPYYEVVLLPNEVVLDPGSVADGNVVITVIGMSPSDSALGGSELGLQRGSEIFAFVRSGQIAWWDGSYDYDKIVGSFSFPMKPVLQFMGVPSDSFLRLDSDGYYRLSSRADQYGGFTVADLARLVQQAHRNQ